MTDSAGRACTATGRARCQTSKRPQTVAGPSVRHFLQICTCPATRPGTPETPALLPAATAHKIPFLYACLGRSRFMVPLRQQPIRAHVSVSYIMVPDGLARCVNSGGVLIATHDPFRVDVPYLRQPVITTSPSGAGTASDATGTASLLRCLRSSRAVHCAS